jgi:hypothetical protein
MAERKRIAEALEILRAELLDLGCFFVLTEKTGQEADQLGAAQAEVFPSVHQAAWRALLIGLAGLLSTDQESITLVYLLDLATNHPYGFNEVSPDELRTVVDKARGELRSYSYLEQRLRAIRDRRLAHVDRKLINEPELVGKLQIGIVEAGEVLNLIEAIVEELYFAFHGERLSFEAQRQVFGAALDDLLIVSTNKKAGS